MTFSDDAPSAAKQAPGGASPAQSLAGGMMISTSAARARAELDTEQWETTEKWWNLGTYAALGLFVAMMLISDVTGYNLWIAVAGAALIAVAWWLIGARAASTERPLLVWTYLAIAILTTLVVTAVTGLGPFILIVIFTHVWMLVLNTRIGVIAVLAVSVGVVLSRWGYLGWDLRILPEIATGMAMTTLFSLGLGYFIHYVIAGADRTAALLLDLRATQDALAASQHEAGVAAERERVSREIHDTLAQGFMSVVTLAQVAGRSLDKGDADAARERVALMEATARENLAEARALVAGYAPVDLQRQSLGAALTRIARRWSDETGIDAAVTIADDVPTLPSSHEVALLRAAQEALTNVRRHADAKAVSVALRHDEAAITLLVADDGVGIADCVEPGFGLAGMRDRVKAVGGSVDVAPTVAGRGTAVTIRVPCPAN